MTKVLKSSMRILRYIGLRNKPIIIRCKIKIVFSTNVVRLVFLVTLISSIIPVGVFAYQNHSGFHNFSSQIFILAGPCSAYLTYIDYIRSSEILEKTVNSLKHIVETSELLIEKNNNLTRKTNLPSNSKMC